MTKELRYKTVVKIQAALREHYPTLHLLHSNGQWLIQGRLPVYIEDTEVDNYLIEVIIPDDFPTAIPVFREVGGRIPQNMDWHVKENGFCCPFVDDEQWRYWPTGSGVLEFLRGPVNDYFCSQTYRMRFGRYPFGERSHGSFGIWEYYTDELGTANLLVIIGFLAHLSEESIKLDWPCFCGSRKALQHCHLDKIREFRKKINRQIARNSFVQMQHLWQLQMSVLRSL